MGECVLEASGLRRRYDTVGVLDASINVAACESVAVLGRSGSGKSTLVAMLAGLCRPQSGTVTLHIDQPCDLWSLTTAERCRLRRGPIGFVSQFTSLLPAFTTLENLMLPAQLAGKDGQLDLQAMALDGLKAVGLEHRRDTLASQLSGGEQRRAIVARGLMARPRLLLADEPTSNLDEASEEDVFRCIQQLCTSAGTALVMVTHNQELAKRCDRMLILDQGVLREPGSACVPAPARATKHPDGVHKDVADPQRRRLLLGGFTVAMALTGATGLATRALEQRKEVAHQAGNQIQRLAFSGLSAELTSVERMGSNGYRGTIAVENLDALQSLYLLPLDVQIYVQQGNRWNPFAATWSDASRGVVQLRQPEVLQFELRELPAQFTELVPGYLHVRVDVTYAIADGPDPEQNPVERRDSFFVYLLPLRPDAEKLAQNNFPGDPPLFIPMPPH
ncbi:ABC transporter/ ATPase component [Synechococcus sp. NOUM97013]|nr:ABC transporter/ ATPase component [Synechococcus sp. NOUM97013]